MSVANHRATPAGVAQQSQALPPGTRLGEFEVVSLLGVGGFGMVYQAFDHQLQRFVAIKEYMPAALAGRADGHSLWVRSSSDEQSFQAGLASFVDEARLLARFEHPSLVKVLRFWEANHTAYMVMPLYCGMTLKQARAHMRTPPPEAWLRTLLWSVTSALRVLHDGQTLHRDISPDNIFLQNHGPPVLLDLGAARHAISNRRQPAVLKVNYAPLEQYTDAPADMQQGPWSDLYALGATVHGCLRHGAPQPATQRAQRDRMLPMARVARQVRKQFGIEYSSALVDAMAQCLALQPQYRPQSVAELLLAMEMDSAPPGLESFDFRAQLGASWVEPQDRHAEGVAVPVVNTQIQTQASAPQQPAAPLPTHSQRRRRLRPHRSPQVRRTLWAMAGSAAVLVMAAGLWWEQKPRAPRQTPESEIITELAETEEPRPLAPMVQPARQAMDGGMRQAHPAPAPELPASTLEPMPQPGLVVLEAAMPAPPQAYLRAGNPLDSCASAGFWARSMCIHRACQEDGIANHPVCVDERVRREAQERQRQLYGQ